MEIRVSCLQEVLQELMRSKCVEWVKRCGVKKRVRKGVGVCDRGPRG